MKKALVIAALFGMIATPAFAGLVPASTTVEGVYQVTAQGHGAGVRTPGPYLPDDPNHMYDSMGNYTVGGVPLNAPHDIVWAFTIPAGTALLTDAHLRPGATAVSSAHLIWGAVATTGPATIPLLVGFFSGSSDDQSLNPIPLTFGGFSSPAVFTFLMPRVSLGIFNLTFPQVPVPAHGDLWVMFMSPTDSFRVQGGDGPNGDGSFSHGQAGASPTATSNYIGSGHNELVLATFSTSTFSIISAGLYNFIGPSGLPISNIHLALGGKIPEPATIGLIAIGGLVLLRRRKA